jgi:hypothetical protein
MAIKTRTTNAIWDNATIGRATTGNVVGPIVIYNNTDIGSQINALIIAGNKKITIMNGNYILTTPIDIRHKSSLIIKGEDKRLTVILSNLSNQSVIDGKNTIIQSSGNAGVNGNEISNITFDNTNKNNIGGICIDLDWMVNGKYEDLAIKNFDNSIRVKGGSYYNHFADIDLNNYNKPLILDTSIDSASNTGTPNSCQFNRIKFLGGLGSGRVEFNSGNDNHFNNCQFEQNNKNLFCDGLGSSFNNCRFENSTGLGIANYIELGVNSRNILINNCYLSGSDYNTAPINSNIDIAITDLGQGNSYSITGTFLEQKISYKRNKTAAGNLMSLERQSSGDLIPLLKIKDSYINSGTTTGMEILAVRPGKAISNLKSGIEKSYITNDGAIYAAGSINGALTPTYNGKKAWTFDPAGATANSLLPLGSSGLTNQLAIARISYADNTATINNVTVWVSIAGLAVTNCYAAIYSVAGTLLGVSTEIGATMVTTGSKVFNFVTPITVPSSDFLVAIWAGGATTAPTLARGAGINAFNIGLTPTNYRFMSTNDLSITTTPPTTLGTRSQPGIAWLMLVD